MEEVKKTGYDRLRSLVAGAGYGLIASCAAMKNNAYRDFEMAGSITLCRKDSTTVFDYFYGIQSEQFAFIRVPRVFFTDKQYSNLSTDAKVLYGILLSRMELSAKNGWMDEEGKVYIIFTIEEIQESLGCGNKKAVTLMNDLENKAGLIERKRLGLGKPNLIYVKNFASKQVMKKRGK